MWHICPLPVDYFIRPHMLTIHTPEHYSIYGRTEYSLGTKDGRDYYLTKMGRSAYDLQRTRYYPTLTYVILKHHSTSTLIEDRRSFRVNNVLPSCILYIKS